jgi:TRAP-type mannitol/chloroaromatic compound transport system substrate-binding protein
MRQSGIQIRAFPDDVMSELGRISKQVLEELAAEDPMSARVVESFNAYFANVRGWTDVSERYYLDKR